MKPPFAPLALSAAERQRFRRLADALLRDLLREVDRMGSPRVFSKSRWKQLKTHDGCTMYQDRVKATAAPAASTTASSSSSSSSGLQVAMAVGGSGNSASASPTDDEDTAPAWKMPELVVSGAVRGTLEDVLYGLATHDATDVLLRAAHAPDGWLAAAAVLCAIETPTPADPFRFLGLKWHVARQAKGVVLPRDFIFLEAAGLHTRADGARVGYVLRHPVALAACPPLAARHGVRRGRLASYALFSPALGGAVDLFVRGRVALSGRVAPPLATAAATAMLLSSARAVPCSYSKKLAWLLRGAEARRDALLADSALRCAVCIQRLGRLRTAVACCVCDERICSRCRVSRSLSVVSVASPETPETRVREVDGAFCNNCVARANASSALEVARQEILAGRYGPVVAADGVELPSEMTTTTAAEEEAVEGEIVYVESVSSGGSWGRARELKDGDDEDDEWTPVIPYAVEHVYEYQDPARETPLARRQELWRKMAALREQAEHVFELTKKTSDLHLRLHGGGGGPHSTETYDSDDLGE